MSNTMHNQDTMQSTTDGRSMASRNNAADRDQQTRKPRRFAWLLDESVCQGFLLVAVLVALVGALSSGNYGGIA